MTAHLLARFNSPFYRKQLTGLQSAAWNELPYTTKADLRKGYPFELLACDISQVVSYHESSGTTGHPTATAFTAKDWDDITTRFLQSAIALTSSDWVLIKTPYALVTTAHQMERAARQVGATVVPADNRSSNISYRKVIRLLRDLPITVAWCLPTEACLWARAARLLGYDPAVDFPHLRALWVAGEPLSDAKRDVLSKAWGGIPVYRDYGSTETGSLAGECTHGKMHLWSDNFQYEVLTATGPQSSGEGSLVVTLARQAMPLLRYDLGDIVQVSQAFCACGSARPVIQIKGRKSDVMPGLYQEELEDIIFQHLDAENSDIAFWRARVSTSNQAISIDVDRNWTPGLVPALTKKYGKMVSVNFKKDIVITHELTTESPPFLKPQYIYSDAERNTP